MTDDIPFREVAPIRRRVDNVLVWSVNLFAEKLNLKRTKDLRLESTGDVVHTLNDCYYLFLHDDNVVLFYNGEATNRRKKKELYRTSITECSIFKIYTSLITHVERGGYPFIVKGDPIVEKIDSCQKELDEIKCKMAASVHG